MRFGTVTLFLMNEKGSVENKKMKRLGGIRTHDHPVKGPGRTTRLRELAL